MDLSKLEIGTKLELELLDDAGEKLDLMLVSEYEWHEENNSAVIAAPIHEGKIYPLHIGAVMNVYFLKRRESEINLYKFSAMVKARGKSENLHFIRIEQLDRISRVQRRRYFRLDCSLRVKYRVVNNVTCDQNIDDIFLESIANNLSGGGLNLMLEERIEKGKFVECKVFLDDIHKVNFTGQVVTSERRDIESKFKYEVGITFVKISNGEREAVVRYIFEEQRKLRKKGLI